MIDLARLHAELRRCILATWGESACAKAKLDGLDAVFAVPRTQLAKEAAQSVLNAHCARVLAGTDCAAAGDALSEAYELCEQADRAAAEALAKFRAPEGRESAG